MSVSTITSALLDRCPQACARHQLEPGRFVYQPADVDTTIYLLEKGLVKIGSLGAMGERVLYDLLQPGELFGDLDYLDEAEFFEFAQAATPLSILAIHRPTFRHAVVHDPGLAAWFQETLVRRWHRAETRLLHRSSESVAERIDRLNRQYATPIPDAHNRLHHPLDRLSLQEIGDLVGTTRQTVSRTIKTRPVLASRDESPLLTTNPLTLA
jgi:CRP-like cAMP-binding protein